MNAANPTVMTDLERRQALFARRITYALNERALPHDIEQRLRVSRDMAVTRARAARALALQHRRSGGMVVVGAGQAALGGGADRSSSWWAGLSLLGLGALLIAGLLAIDYRSELAQIEAAAEVDAAILADDLPPDAYSDAGFREFLRLPVPPTAGTAAD